MRFMGSGCMSFKDGSVSNEGLIDVSAVPVSVEESLRSCSSFFGYR